ncbi:hypothetical protein D3C81_1694010 [compost metagenome]
MQLTGHFHSAESFFGPFHQLVTRAVFLEESLGGTSHVAVALDLRLRAILAGFGMRSFLFGLVVLGVREPFAQGALNIALGLLIICKSRAHFAYRRPCLAKRFF